MNRAIPVVEFANEAYTIFLKHGGTEEMALAVARHLGGNHALGESMHYFTDEEIRTGVCGCDHCNKKEVA